MKKLFKGIFAGILALGSFCGIESLVLNLTCINAYAEAKDEKSYLKSIYVSAGDDVEFSKDIYSYIVDVRSEDEEIFIRTKPEDEESIIRINGGKITKDDKYKKSIELNMGKNKIEIEVSSNSNFANDEYYENLINQNDTDENNYISDVTKYTVYVFRGGENTVYLNDITLNGNDVGFTSTDTFYNLELDESDNLVDFETLPFDKRDSVYVNKNILSKNHCTPIRFKGIGKYTLTVDVIDYDTKRKGTYIINVYYGIPVTPNVSDSINAVLKPNEWVIVNGRWQKNDALGQAIMNKWYYDDSYKAYFYFNSRGNMKTGWITESGNTYYLGNDGKMQTGWIDYENNWYYLDQNGVMRIGWIKDDDKYYYLNEDGTMKKGWNHCDGKWYYLNKDGSMKTGWLLDYKYWYYFNENGEMQTGWLKYNEDWYYLNNDGSMKSGEWIKYKDQWYYINYAGNMRSGWLYKDDKYYYFNNDGVMQRNPITIDGYLYKFNDDGSVNFE